MAKKKTRNQPKKEKQIPQEADKTTTNITIIMYITILIAIGVSVVTFFIMSQSTFRGEASAPAESVLPNLKMTLIDDSSCSDCFDPSVYIQQMRMELPANVSTETLQYTSSEAQALISQYQLKTVPALIITGEVNDPLVAGLLDPTGEYYVGGAIVFSESMPPYKEIDTGIVRGIVDTVYLVDVSCAECYGVENHRMTLYAMGIYVGNESTVDIATEEGQEIVTKYSITEVPTVLLSPDISAYTGFDQLWLTAGSIEPDGWYVFRGNAQWAEEAAVVGESFAYKDLTTGEVKIV